MEKEQTTIRLPKELKDKLQQQADKRGDSFNGLINMMLYKAFELMRQSLL